MRFERVERKGAVLVELISGSSETSKFIGRILDMSATGMKLNVDSAIPVNSLLNLQLDLDDETFRLKAQVKWARDEGRHYIGLRFDDIASPDIINWYRQFSRSGTAGRLS